MEEEGDDEKEKKKKKQAEPTGPAVDEPGTSAGPARFYDCIFCKRGFTTAQALGGHMNIHRKDRARLRPTGPSSSGPRKGEEAYQYHPYSRAQQAAVPKQTAETSYDVYLPSGSRRVTELVQAGEELRLGLGGSDRKEEKKKGVVDEDLDLDLELRLGHSKSHDSSSD